MKYQHVKLGVKFAGRCISCGQQTGSRPWELAATSLYCSEDGKYVVAHPLCVGGRTKHKIGGGIVYAAQPEDVIER